MVEGSGMPGREAIHLRPFFPLPLWERVDQSRKARLRRVRGLSPRMETPHPTRTLSAPPSPTRGEGKKAAMRDAFCALDTSLRQCPNSIRSEEAPQMTIIDSQVHAYEANTPERPWHSVPNWPDHVTGDEMVT